VDISIPVKYLIVTTASLLATFLCFWLMQLLISMEISRSPDIVPFKITPSYFSPIREREKRESRKKLQKAMPSEPPPTPRGLPNLTRILTTTESLLPNRVSLADMLDTEKMQLEIMPPVKDLAPLFVVQPTYPFAAVMKEIEGYVLVQFTVRQNGTVANAIILDSEPRSIFDDAALGAIRKFKFLPREVGGDPMTVAAVQLRFAFTLEPAYAP